MKSLLRSGDALSAFETKLWFLWCDALGCHVLEYYPEWQEYMHSLANHQKLRVQTRDTRLALSQFLYAGTLPIGMVIRGMIHDYTL